MSIQTRKFISLILLVGVILSCDKNRSAIPVPFALPTTYPKNAWGIGGNLEDDIPGTAITKLSDRNQVYKAVLQSLGNTGTSSGSAVVQAHSSQDYVAVMHFNGKHNLSKSTMVPKPPETMNLQYVIESSGSNNSAEDMTLSLYSAQSGRRTYAFAQGVKQYGLNLVSTDQVALFIATTEGDNFEVIKVGFRESNPLIQWFVIEVSQDKSDPEVDKYNLHSVSRILKTQFRY